MEQTKRNVKVTIEKEFEIEFTPALLNGMTEEEYLTDFRKGLWHVDSMDDIYEYAARMAAYYGGGMQHDGLGLLSESGSTYPRVPDVKFREVYDECETEIVL